MQLNPLIENLIIYADSAIPKAVEVISNNWGGDDEFILACLGRIFQRRASVDRVWMEWVMLNWTKEFIAIAPYIGAVTMQYKSGTLELPPPGTTWAEYVMQIEHLAGMTPAGKQVEIPGDEVKDVKIKNAKVNTGLWAA